MAKAELSVALNKLKGKAGTVVFVDGRDGIYIRPRVTPHNPNTAAQEFVRTNLRKAAIAFKGLNATQLQAWRDYAAFLETDDPPTGKNPKKTAIAAFVELAAKFLQLNPNGTIPVNPPQTSYYGDNITVTATAGTGQVNFTASAPNGINSRTELLLQKLPSANRTPQKGKYLSKGFFQFVLGTLSTSVTVPPGYYAAGYRFVNNLTGQATPIRQIGISQVNLALTQGGAGNKKKAA